MMLVFLGVALGSCSTSPPERNFVEEYKRADFGDTETWPVIDNSYRNRIALEFEIIRSGRVEPLREALQDTDRYVRAFSVAALGILGDHSSEATIAKLVEDPNVDRMVGNAAVQALGWLKSGLEVIRSARAKRPALNRRLLDIAERQIQDPVDHAAMIREAYRLGLRREDIGAAKAGKAAPDFAAIDTDGRPFGLGDVVKEKKVVVLVFVSADW